VKPEDGGETQHCCSVALLSWLELFEVCPSAFWTGLQHWQCIYRCWSSVLKGKPKVVWNAPSSDNLANYNEVKEQEEFSCHTPELSLLLHFWTVLYSPSNVDISQLKWWKAEKDICIWVFKGHSYLPVPAISGVEHFLNKKVRRGRRTSCPVACCHLSLGWEVTGRKGRDKISVLINVKGQTQPDW